MNEELARTVFPWLPKELIGSFAYAVKMAALTESELGEDMEVFYDEFGWGLCPKMLLLTQTNKAAHF